MPSLPALVRSLALVAALATVGAACTGSASSVTVTTSAPATSAGATTTTEDGDADPGADRLVVIDADGNLVTMRPNGTVAVVVADGAGDRLQFQQPTWSPDGSRLAWTEIDGRSGTVETALVTASATGEDLRRAAVPFAPFYLYWDPTATRLAYLGTGAARLEMGILDVANATAETIDGGQPYYFAWAPDGSELLVHVGTRRLQWMTPSGETTDVGPSPGRFPAPDWSAAGDRVAYAAAEGGTQYLAVAGRDGSEQRIADFDGFVSFALSPDGSRIAYQAFSGPGGDQGVTAGGPGLLAAAAPTAQAAGGALTVTDLATGQATTISLTPELAFFWSPQGDKLLSLGRDPGASAASLRWQVWEDGDSFTTGTFTPSVRFLRDYLPFFDQYARSMSLWAPDGSAFAYAGIDDSGESGIWVQPAAAGFDPVRVADGSFVAWSAG